MNFLFYLLILSVGLTFVVCDQRADIQCINNGTQAYQSMTDQQVYNLTQQNLNTGKNMAQARANIALANGMTCYKQYYDNYTNALQNSLITGETSRLDKSRTPAQRSGAIRALGTMSQGIICDENWRAVNFNQTIASVVCTAQELRGRQYTMLNFRPKLNKLTRTMLQGKLALRFNNRVVTGILGELSTLYRNLYNANERCSATMITPADRCRSRKMFMKELDRLYYAFEVQSLSARRS